MAIVAAAVYGQCVLAGPPANDAQEHNDRGNNDGLKGSGRAAAMKGVIKATSMVEVVVVGG